MDVHSLIYVKYEMCIESALMMSLIVSYLYNDDWLYNAVVQVLLGINQCKMLYHIVPYSELELVHKLLHA